MLKHKNRLRLLYGLAFAMFLAALPELVSAQATATGATLAQSTPVMLVRGAVEITKFFTGIMHFLAFFLLSLLELVMNPEFMFGLNPDVNGDPNMNLMNILREIWQFTRDLVNIGFAIALVIGAITMIVTADNTKIKEHLKTFVIALVLVNFSWFIPRVIFDFSQVVTYTVYQIPSLLGADTCVRPPEGTDTQPQPCEVVTQYKFLDDTRLIGTIPDTQEGYTSLEDGSTGWRCPIRSLLCYQRVPITQVDAQVALPTRIFHGLVVNHARLQWLMQIQPEAVNEQLPPDASWTTIFRVLAGTIIKLFIVLLIHIAIVFPLMAMVVAFFIRIPILWISIAFMPLVALGYAFPKFQEEYKEVFMGWRDHFLQAVFLPAKVAVPFVIGYIMLNAAAQVQPPSALGDIPLLPLFVGVRDLWQFVWMGIALFVIWHYSFEALKGDKAGFMGHFTETIQGIGSSLGSLAAQAPLSVPFIPMPGRRPISPLQMSHGLDPRRVSSFMRNNGELPSIDQLFSGNRPAPPNEGIVKVLSTHNQTINIQQQLVKGTAGAPAEQQVALRQTLQQLQTHHSANPLFQPLTNRQVLQDLIRTGELPPAELKRLQDVLAAPENAGLMNAPFRTPVNP